MKRLTRTDKRIRFGALSLIAGLSLPLACSDDSVADEPAGMDGGVLDGGLSRGGKGDRPTA